MAKTAALTIAVAIIATLSAFAISVGALVVDSMWRSGNPADRAGVVATGELGLCDFGSPP
ncbi:MAG TPA: hypothetical protein VFG85_10450 [Gaiellaceae bacterium]|jgi:hypothetical protein|nr:hypothetical protein [Gaiellaceae bacterium]